MIIIPQAPTLRGTTEQMMVSIQKYLRELSDVLPMAFEESAATASTNENTKSDDTAIIRQDLDLVQTKDTATFVSSGTYYFPQMGVCTARLEVQLSAELAASKGISVAGIPTDFLPPKRTALSAYTSSGSACQAMASSTSGIYVYTQAKIPTSAYIYINGFWFL